MQKKILLIGGSYGIGQAIASSLATTHEVHIAARTQEGVPAGCHYHQFDVSTDDISELPLPEQLHGFAYCPGSINLRPFHRLKEEAFQNDMNINFMALMRSVQQLLPRFKNAEGASLVFFSTVAVGTGMPFHTSVAAAKGAIEGFSRALAAEYAPMLRVNVIAPSLTDTPLAGKLLSSPEKKDKMGERHPLKRVGTPEDIAQVACFLLGDEASWITGQVIGVDGGMSTLNIS